MLAILDLEGPGQERQRRRMLSTLSTAVGAVVLGRVFEGTAVGEELVECARVELRVGRL